MRGRLLLAAVGMVCLLSGCGGGGGSQAALPAVKAPVAAPPQQRARLVVVRSRLGPPNFALVTLGPNAGDRATVAGSRIFVGLADPVWSPDGRRLYFTGTATGHEHVIEGDTDIFELRAGGGGLRRITHSGDAASPAV